MKFGIERAQVQSILRGSMPAADTAFRIAEILKVDPRWLVFGGEGEEEKIDKPEDPEELVYREIRRTLKQDQAIAWMRTAVAAFIASPEKKERISDLIDRLEFQQQNEKEEKKQQKKGGKKSSAS